MVTSSCFLFSMVLVVLIQFIRTSETNITTDQSALLAFRAHIINLDPQHILATNWSSATPVCNWAGVTCSHRHYRVAALNLSYMGLVGTIPPDIGNISFLASLDIRNNSFSGNLPKEMAHLCRLKELNLDYNDTNQFTGAIPQSLGHLELLEILALDRNNFVSRSSTLELSFLTSLTSCRKLSALALNYNRLNGFLPVSIGNLSTSLKELWLGGNGIMGTFPREIGNLSSLFLLSLRGNILTGSIPTTIARLQKLQGLDLSDNQIGGPIPTEFCHLPNFGSLSLRRNQFSGPVPACLGNVSSLRYLYLGANKLSSSIPESLWNLKDLLEFDVSSNSLGGVLPSGLGSLRVAIAIDLSINQFSGNISATIGVLQNLIHLSLAHNTLQGNIPETFRSLISLEALDLSHNNLSGVIPKSLEALSQLRYFNISFNELSGEIPSGGPFENFTSQSFASNEALCGLMQFGVPQCHAVYRSRTAERIIIISVLSTISFTVLVMGVLFVLIRRRKSKRVPTEKGLQPLVHRQITYLEIFQATNGFVESNLIGSGSFGSVYKGVMPDGMAVAIKVFKLHPEKALKSFVTECEVLRNIRHRNLTKVITSCSNLDFRALVMEYMPNGSLEDLLYSHDHYLGIKQRLDIMIDVACALDYLHHEYGLGGLVSTSSDVYSYGIMLMETFTRTKPADEFFAGGMTLRLWVRESLPNEITKVVDMNLLRQGEELLTKDVQCLTAIMELALECTKESAKERFIRTSETNITTDQSALLAFRAHIINLNPQHILATNWSSATPVCNWAGVTCSRRHNRVAALNLSYMGLVGTIPPDIGKISFLASLDIRNNSFSGNLPKEMARLHRLKETYLDYNEFSGGLPTRPQVFSLCLLGYPTAFPIP
ncbi:hypothetical protein RJ640_028659 [Escallonia rubra]|uniref:Protein kinase domain-containing protein n=1 Tax=Escallonia rubra TaxID=112253 RepID=A0AA88R531_9ASTE|nr:hypothetical protein RJ640_028659 [Escallonia rubra]